MLGENNAVMSLKQKYAQIKSIYGIAIPFRENDLLYSSSIAEEMQDWKALRELGELSISLYPNLTYGYYTLATVEEKNDNLEEALKLYKKGYSKIPKSTINKADFYTEIERVEKLITKKNK